MTTKEKVPATEDVVLIERRAHVLKLTINRPNRRNSLTNEVIRQLVCGIVDTRNDRTIKAIVISGSGTKAFCAGADLRDVDTPFSLQYSTYNTPFANLLRAGIDCDVPIVGRINGACLAGGMGLFGICDIVVAAESAQFGLPEVKVGLFPMQVLAVLRGMIPRRMLNEMCITGEPISAATALTAGLVNYVVPDLGLDIAVDRVLERISMVSSSAVRRGKYAMRSMDAMSFHQMIAFAEGQVVPMSMTEDAQEGREAFAARRAPSWPGDL